MANQRKKIRADGLYIGRGGGKGQGDASCCKDPGDFPLTAKFGSFAIIMVECGASE